VKGAASVGAIVAIVVILAVALASVFTVDQTEQAIVLRFGEPVAGRGLITSPGLHFKYPFIENVVSSASGVTTPRSRYLSIWTRKLFVR
jgi:membrane protease subunit HflC